MRYLLKVRSHFKVPSDASICTVSVSYSSKQAKKKKIKVKYQESEVELVQELPEYFHMHKRLFPPTLNSKVKSGIVPEGMRDDTAHTYLTYTHSYKKKKKSSTLNSLFRTNPDLRLDTFQKFLKAATK